MAVDCRGTLYVADVDNNRIQRLGEPGAAPCGDVAHDPAERLVVTAAARTSQRFRTTFAVAVDVACDRLCTATVSGTVKVAGRRRALRVRAQTRALDGVKVLTVRVAPGERDTDLRGQRTTLTRRIRLR